MSSSPSVPVSGAACALVLAFAAACSGGAATEPLACTDRTQCPADAFCRAGACVQSAPPVARIAPIAAGAARANRVLTFDASASSDPDREDRVVSFAWSAARVSAACEPSVVEAADANYRVLFPCAGEFRIEVVATDSAGVSSAPASLGLSVAADELADQLPPPALRTAVALEVDHRCEGEPLSCTPLAEGGATTFELSATASGGRGPLALRWTASPPPGLTTPHTLAFSDPTVAAPTVTLHTSGPIAGTWTFTVLAIDADGRASVAEQRVVVGNRPPVLVEALAPLAVNHRYEASDASFRAEGTLSAAPQFVDPDGDPVAVSFAAEASGDGGHGFTVQQDGAFSLRIPDAEPQHLIGEDVVRRIAVEAGDGNGGRAAAAIPLTVLNRPPRLAVPRGVVTAPHAYDAARQVYTATATLSDYVDDDGDPLVPGSTFELAPAGCSRLSLSGPTLALECEVPFSTIAALSTLARTHVLDVTVRDAWAHSARATARVDVTNRPPRIVADPQVRAASVTSEDCCTWNWMGDDCITAPIAYAAGDGTFSGVEDPDGDPLDVTYDRTSTALLLSRGSATACRGADCAVGLHLDAAGSLTACVDIPVPELRVLVTDGASAEQKSLPVRRVPR